LVAALAAEPGRPSVESARRVRALGVGTVGKSVLIRLARLGGDCQRVTEALAVFGPGSPLRHAAALAGLDRSRAEAAADKLRAAGLVSADRELSFVHPIVHEAVAAQLPPSHRARLHLEAARLLVADGAPADRVATQLLAAEPYGEPWVIDALRGAARQALAQGAPETAAAYLRRALLEPPSMEARLEVLVELGRAEALLPAPTDFAALREALELATEPQRRAQIALELAFGLAFRHRYDEVVAVVEPVVDASEALDEQLREQLEGLLIGAGEIHLATSKAMIARAARHFPRAERGELRSVEIAALAQTAAVSNRSAEEAAALARIALADNWLVTLGPAQGGTTTSLAWTDRLEEAAWAQDAMMHESQRRGSAPAFMMASVFRGETAWRAGELDVAEAHLQRGFELGQELGAGPFALIYLIPVLLERSRLDDASELVEALELTDADLTMWQGVIALADRGRVRAERGDLERGVEDLLDADRRMRAGGLRLSVLCDWAPTAALALAKLERHDEARRLARRELDAAIHFGAPRGHGLRYSQVKRDRVSYRREHPAR
jgi:hypothetical protein